MKRIALLFLCLTLTLFAVNKYSGVDKSVAPTEKTRGARYEAAPSVRVGKVEYRPATRQPVILFVEDPGNTGFGPLIKPDPLWDTTLTHIVGAGNFGWFGATTIPEEDGPDLATMQAYDLVIWNCYDFWWAPPALTANDMNNIQNYISGGGKVWLLGHDIIWSGVPLAWLQTNFHLQSAVEDYVFDIATLNLQGLAEIAGITVTVTSDYQANNFFSDDLTPDANAHHVILDVDYSAYPSIMSNDLTTSFWTVDGRLPNPVANWEQMVQNMLEAFGVLGPAAFWDFEDGWQGWTHTNGLSFPEAWDVQPSDLHANAMSPDPGDSSMWIDSDSAGSGVTVVDTAWSPAVVPPTNMLWFKYGIGYQNLAFIDTFYVGIREFTGGAWQPPVLLQLYDYDVGAGYWDSVDVSAFAGADSVQVFFAYNDYGAFAWWASFDNVGLYPGPGHDVGCTEITSPPEGGLIAAGDYDVIGRIQNFGDAAETFDVTANVYDTLDAWNLIFTQTVTFTDFPDGGDSLHNFGLVTFEEDKVYYTEIFTLLAGDDNPANDTSAIYTNTVTYDLIWDFEDGWQDWTHTNGLSFPEAWDRLQNPYIWPEWTPPDAGNWTMWIDSDSAYPPNVWVQDTALSPVIVPDVTTEWLRWGVGYWHLGTQFMDVGVKYFDGVNWTAISLRNYTGANYGPDWDSVDVSAYNTYDSLQIFFYFDDDFGWNWLASFDNVMINGYTGVSEEPGTHEILAFGFAPHMPNPIKGHAAIGYMTTMPGKVVLKIYDATGRLIRTLVDKHESAGVKNVFWNGRDDVQRKVADGVYFLRLEAEDRVDTRKMIFVR